MRTSILSCDRRWRIIVKIVTMLDVADATLRAPLGTNLTTNELHRASTTTTPSDPRMLHANAMCGLSHRVLGASLLISVPERRSVHVYRIIPQL